MNAPASQVSIKFDVKGFNATISNGLCSSHDAFRYAYQLLVAEKVKYALCGGSEEKSSYFSQILSGLHYEEKDLGEGSVVFLIERMSSALERNQKPVALLKYNKTITLKNSFYHYPEDVEAILLIVDKVLRLNDLLYTDIDLLITSESNNQKNQAFHQELEKRILKKFTAKISKPLLLLGDSMSASGGFQYLDACLHLQKKDRNTVLILMVSPLSQLNISILQKPNI